MVITVPLWPGPATSLVGSSSSSAEVPRSGFGVASIAKLRSSTGSSMSDRRENAALTLGRVMFTLIVERVVRSVFVAFVLALSDSAESITPRTLRRMSSEP
jgi:hypothetical protein